MEFLLLTKNIQYGIITDMKNQDELAQAFGVTQGTISKYINGKLRLRAEHVYILKDIGYTDADIKAQFPNSLKQTIPTEATHPQVDEEKQNHTRSAA